MIIYKITNLINGKIYIGQTINDLQSRINGHLSYKSKSQISLALRKYGIDSFDIDIIKTCKNQEELDFYETYFISEYNSFIPNGYNCTKGGRNGTSGRVYKPLSEEHKRKISESAKNTYKNQKVRDIISKKGKERFSKIENRLKHSKDIKKSMTDEVKLKISKANKGKVLSEETKRKISESKINYYKNKQ